MNLIVILVAGILSLVRGAGDVHVSTYGLAQVDDDGVQWVVPDLNALLGDGVIREGPATVHWTGDGAFVRLTGGKVPGWDRYDAATGCPRSFLTRPEAQIAAPRCGWHVRGDWRAVEAIAAAKPLMLSAMTAPGWRREFKVWSASHAATRFFYYSVGMLLYPGQRQFEVSWGGEGAAEKAAVVVDVWNTWSGRPGSLFVIIPFGSETLVVHDTGVLKGARIGGDYVGALLDAEDPRRASSRPPSPGLPMDLRGGRFVLFRK